jgi:hypothetical protein
MSVVPEGEADIPVRREVIENCGVTSEGITD